MLCDAVHRQATKLCALFDGLVADFALSARPRGVTFVSRALKERGYGVIEADSAERAMERLMLRQQPLALLLSDVGLPGVSGADLVRQARLVKPGLPTLLISATPKQALVRDGVIREGTDLLQKPFSIADLFAKLEKLLPQPSSATAHAR